MKVLELKEHEPELVTFEQAEMLAQLFNYREKCRHFYHVKTKLLGEHDQERNHNLSRTWMGVNGWSYSCYSAPTKDAAIEFLSELAVDLTDRVHEKVN